MHRSFITHLIGLVPLSASVAALALRYENQTHFIAYAIFFVLLFLLSYIDIRTYTLPDTITLPGAVLALLGSVFLLDNSWQESAGGALAGSGTFWLISWYYFKFHQREVMGLGDAKFMLMIGSICGLSALPFVIAASILAGSLLGLVVMLQSNARSNGLRSIRIPFGPCLSVGTVAYILVG